MNITKNLKKGDSTSCTYIIEIVNNIISAFKEIKSRDTPHNLILLKTLLSLKNYFNQNLSEEYFKSFINLLNQVITDRIICKSMPQNDLQSLIEFSKVYIQDVSQCELMLQFGCEYASTKDLNEGVSLTNALRKLLITWFSHRK